MKKKQTETRTSKFKEYREEIKNIPIDAGKKSSVFKSKDDKNDKKHYLSKKEKQKIKKEKTALDEYLKKSRIKKFLYICFVIIIITALVLLTIYLCNKFSEMNLW